MKKILLTGLLISLTLNAMPAMCSWYTDISGMQNPNNELRLLDQQRFRNEEYNEFRDMKQVKERRNKKIELEQQMKQVEQRRPSAGNSQNINLYRENGRLILKQID